MEIGLNCSTFMATRSQLGALTNGLRTTTLQNIIRKSGVDIFITRKYLSVSGEDSPSFLSPSSSQPPTKPPTIHRRLTLPSPESSPWPPTRPKKSSPLKGSALRFLSITDIGVVELKSQKLQKIELSSSLYTGLLLIA